MGEVEFDAERDRSERAAALLAAVGWLVALPLLVVAVLRIVAHDAVFPLIILNAMTAWLYLPAWLVLLLAWKLRRRALAVCAGAVALAQLVWMAPGALFAETAETAGPHLRVMSANVLMVNDDTAGIVAEVEAAQPDVLLVQELTAHWAVAFDTPRLRERLPYRIVLPQEDSFGIALYSRLPFAEQEVLWFEQLPAIRVDLSVQGRPVRLLNVHTLPPRTTAYTKTWNLMMEQLRGILGEARRGALILGGDLNATPHAAWYGRLLSTGLRGAHESRGRGLATTWPNGRMSYPSIRLDHLLVSRELAVIDVREGVGRGSDHRPIVVDLAFR